MKIKKISISSFIVLFSIPLLLSVVSAHVMVKPNQVGVGSFETFSIGVPVEKDVPTTSLKLMIPDGLKEVVPNVKAGWNIKVIKNGTDETSPVKEIDWTGGLIPAVQRDDFLFSAQVPSTVTTLKWKTYQTYQDGSVVSWDQDPTTIKSGEEGNPYSQTKIINDLTPSVQPVVSNSISASSDNGEKYGKLGILLGVLGTVFGIVGITVAIIALNKNRLK